MHFIYFSEFENRSISMIPALVFDFSKWGVEFFFLFIIIFLES